MEKIVSDSPLVLLSSLVWGRDLVPEYATIVILPDLGILSNRKVIDEMIGRRDSAASSVYAVTAIS